MSQESGSGSSNKSSSNKASTTFALLAAAGAGALVGFVTNSLLSQNSDHCEENTRPEQQLSSRTIPIQPPDQCIICFEKLNVPIEQLPCSHMFHKACILTWIENSKFCPVCRYTMNQSQINVYRHRFD